MSPASKPSRSSRGGFTLVELLVSSAIAIIVMAGVLSAALMITRSGFLLGNYIDMETQARTALETLATDSRVARDSEWIYDAAGTKFTGIILTMPDKVTKVTYAYDADAGTLTRTKNGFSRNMITGVQSLSFTAYKNYELTRVQAVEPTDFTPEIRDADTKMIQISLSALRSRSSLADATNNVVSARYVLRNKTQS